MGHGQLSTQHSSASPGPAQNTELDAKPHNTSAYACVVIVERFAPINGAFT